MSEKHNSEKSPVYTKEDFLRESEEHSDTLDEMFTNVKEVDDSRRHLFFLNNIRLSLPLKPNKGALYRDIQRGAVCDVEIPARTEDYFNAVDNFFTEKGLDLGDTLVDDFAKNNESILIELYIYLRNKGFTHEEITA